MSSVILIGLLLLGLVAGFYVSAQLKQLQASGKRSPGRLLWLQARRRFRSWSRNFSGGGSNSSKDK